MAALQALLRRDLKRNEPLQQSSVVLGQVLPSLKDDAVIKAAALDLCRAALTSADVFEQILGMAALDAVFSVCLPRRQSAAVWSQGSLGGRGDGRQAAARGSRHGGGGAAARATAGGCSRGRGAMKRQL